MSLSYCHLNNFINNFHAVFVTKNLIGIISELFFHWSLPIFNFLTLFLTPLLTTFVYLSTQTDIQFNQWPTQKSMRNAPLNITHRAFDLLGACYHGNHHSYHKFFTSVYIDNLILKHTSSVYSVYSPNQEVLFQKGHQNRKYSPQEVTIQAVSFQNGQHNRKQLSGRGEISSVSLVTHFFPSKSSHCIQMLCWKVFLKLFRLFAGGGSVQIFFFTQKNSEARSVLKYIFFFWNIFPDWILQLLLFSLLVIVSHWRSCLVTIS